MNDAQRPTVSIFYPCYNDWGSMGSMVLLTLQTAEDLGISMADAKNQYLAYHEGRAGYSRGSYRRKGWLMRISDEVADRAVVYDAQLRSCGMV